MKWIALAITLVLTVANTPAARAESWTIQSDALLTLSQSAYSDNWKGSETGVMNWALSSTTVAEKQIFARVFNKNTLRLAYGLTYGQDEATNKWGAGVKTTDLIDLESTFRWTLGTFVEPIIAFRAISQFLDETDPTRDRWINPLVLTESVGIAKVFRKDEKSEWQTRFGVAAKQSINRDEPLDLLDPQSPRETMTQYDGGFELVNDLKLPMASEKILWTSKLTVFQGVLSSASDDLQGTPQEDYWRYPRVNFENTFSSDVTKYISVNLYIQVLYDRQIDRDASFRQTLALGLTYKLL